MRSENWNYLETHLPFIVASRTRWMSLAVMFCVLSVIEDGAGDHNVRRLKWIKKGIVFFVGKELLDGSGDPIKPDGSGFVQSA